MLGSARPVSSLRRSVLYPWLFHSHSSAFPHTMLRLVCGGDTVHECRSAPPGSTGWDRKCCPAPWEGNGTILWQWGFTLEPIGPLCHPLATTPTTVASLSTCVLQITAIRCCAQALALLTEALDRLNLSPWHHLMVTNSHCVYKTTKLSFWGLGKCRVLLP